MRSIATCNRTAAFFCILIVACVAQTALGGDWRQFRGNTADSVTPREQLPATLKKESNLAWKAPLSHKGVSGPIVVDGKVFVTSSSGYEQDRLHIECYDAKTGDRLWHRQFWATGRTQCHPKMAVATPTPASDGERVFAFYSSNDLVCLDLDGNLLWYRGLGHDFPNASNSLGMASSPIVVDETVIVQIESDAEAFATGLDVATGTPRWRIKRPQAANWTSPAILGGKENVVLLQSSRGVAAVEPRTGKQLWEYTEGASTIPSSTVSGGLVFVPSHGLTALRPIPDSSAPELLWQENRLRPSTASPVAADGHVFTVNSAGVVNCADTKSGDIEWRVRVKGPFSATPVLAGKRLYFVNEDGLVQIVQVGADSGEAGGTFPLEDRVIATPAAADGALYVRSDKALWKLSDSEDN